MEALMARAKEWTVYLGMSESHAYTMGASSLRELKAKVAASFGYEGCRWYKEPMAEGLPLGAQRFKVKKGSFVRPVLVIPKKIGE